MKKRRKLCCLHLYLSLLFLLTQSLEISQRWKLRVFLDLFCVCIQFWAYVWLSKFLSICYSWLLWNALISQTLSQAFPPRLSVLCCMPQSQSFVPGYWVFFVHLTTFSRNVFCISSMDVFWLRWNKDHRQCRTDIKKISTLPPPEQGPEPNTEHRLPSSRPPLILGGGGDIGRGWRKGM